MKAQWICAAWALLATPAWSADEESFVAPPAAAAAWLELEGDATATGMAGAGSAATGGLGSLGANPAGLAGLDGMRLGFTHQGLAEGYAANRFAIGGRAAGGGLALALDQIAFAPVDFIELDAQGELAREGSIRAAGLALGLGYGRRLGRLDLGAAVRGIQDDPDGQGFAAAFSGDLGAALDLGWGVRVAASLNQWGTGLFGSSLPTQGRLGAALTHPAGGELAMTWAFEQRIPTLDASQASSHLGAELGLGALARLRGGWQHYNAVGEGLWRAGLGARYGAYQVDYAYAAELGQGGSHQLSLGMDWSQAFAGRSAQATEGAAAAPAADAGATGQEHPEVMRPVVAE